MQPHGIFILVGLLVVTLAVSAPGDPTRSPRHDGLSPGKQAVMAARGAGQSDTAMPRGPVISPDDHEPDREPAAGIRCNWDGWQYGRTPRDCWRCETYADTLRTLCTNGRVRRMEKVQICIHCWDGK